MSNLTHALNRRYHYVYLTTNNVNKKYYIGVHSSDDLENTYLGSGTYLKRAIKVHGRENFTKTILAVLQTREEASALEAKLVTMEVVKDKSSYNQIPGGDAPGPGWKHTEKANELNRQAHLGKTHLEETKEKCRQIMLDEHGKRREKGNGYERLAEVRRSPEQRNLTGVIAKERWADPEYKERLRKTMKEAARSPLFRDKSSLSGHKRNHAMKNVVSEQCRWCQGEQPSWLSLTEYEQFILAPPKKKKKKTIEIEKEKTDE